jgi:hypothetical protein
MNLYTLPTKPTAAADTVMGNLKKRASSAFISISPLLALIPIMVNCVYRAVINQNLSEKATTQSEHIALMIMLFLRKKLLWQLGGCR